MHFSDLVQVVKDEYNPALALRRMFDKSARENIQRNLLIATVFAFFVALVALGVARTDVSQLPFLDRFASLADELWGIFLILLPITFVFSALEAMHRSYYFRGLDNVLKESDDPGFTPVSWEVASIISDSEQKDLTGGFLDSTYGQEILYRSGIEEEAFSEYIGRREQTVAADTFVVERDNGVILASYAHSIYKHDTEFAHFLAENGVSAEHFVRAAQWVTQIERKERRIARWWSRDNLGRVPGIGKTWSYGETYLLDRFGHDLTNDHVWSAALMARHDDQDDEVEEMEQVLARGRQSNVLLVSNDLVSARQKLAQLYHKIRSGLALPPLDAKRVYFIDLEALIASNPNKAAFEEKFVQLLNQAIHAGNIILYFEYFTTAVASANSIDVDLVDVLLPYMESDQVQLVAAATADSFNARLQRDSRLLQAFDVVRTQTISSNALVNVLTQRALILERRTNIVFSIPALEAVGHMADQYFPTGVMPDKAYDLLEELVPMAMSQGIPLLTKAHVESLIAAKTGIPVGTPSEEERDKLLTLEDYLHKRVVGQERAVSAVSKALRRSRSGVSSEEKPMGSFLFLGPTGVGKTETAKALAEALFGDEDAMTRIDMSEFQGADALDHFIGSFETGQPGRLSTLIQEKPYGVLLLDEFEKSNPDLHDLFLQILDEGVFTDAQGKQVNARNLIIIATSNAGADLLWQWEKEKKDITTMKRTLIDTVIDRGLFRPEFLNRFDDIILFHVLTAEQVRTIAEIQLQIFTERLAHDKQIELEVTDDLVDYIAEVGYDPQFGGRPMRRAIKDEVEQAVADQMLAGTVKTGGSIRLDAAALRANSSND